MENAEATQFKFSVDPDSLDADRFVSLWNLAVASCGGDVVAARALAGKLLGFLCKHRCPFVVVSPTDAKYLDEWFERDPSLLYDWNADSEKVDVVAQHAHIPYDAFLEFVAKHKFQSDSNYSPRRAARVEWFTDDWKVG